MPKHNRLKQTLVNDILANFFRKTDMKLGARPDDWYEIQTVTTKDDDTVCLELRQRGTDEKVIFEITVERMG